MRLMFESHWWCMAETLQTGSELDDIKPWLKLCIFKCISFLKGSFPFWKMTGIF